MERVRYPSGAAVELAEVAQELAALAGVEVGRPVSVVAARAALRGVPVTFSLGWWPDGRLVEALLPDEGDRLARLIAAKVDR